MIKRFIPLIISVLILVLAMVSIVVVSHRHQSTLDKQAAQISELQRQLVDVQSHNTSDQQDQTKLVTGLDRARKASDDAAMQAAFQLVTTFSSADEYAEHRSQAMQMLHMDENSTFATEFAPKLDEEKLKVFDPSTMTTRFVKYESYVLKIEGDKYTYLGFITIQGQAAGSGSATATGVQLVEYTVDSNGAVDGFIPQSTYSTYES